MTADLTLTLDGRVLPIAVRRSARARRLSLRLAPDGDGLVVVLPARATLADALAFAQKHGDWVRSRLAALPPRQPFAPGQMVPLLGAPHVLVHRPEARRGVWIENGGIHVSGHPDHLPRRVGDFLKAEARSRIAPRAQAMAARLDRKVARITVKDTRSRWGSCSSAGALAFSWRLVMAPEPVLDYVVAHEVAHLVEMNHSPRFWAQVARLVPDLDQPRAWLKRHGPGLHRYG